MQRRNDLGTALCLSAVTAALQAPLQPSPRAIGLSLAAYGVTWLALAVWRRRCLVEEEQKPGILLRGSAALFAGMQAAKLWLTLPQQFPQQPVMFGTLALVAVALWGALLYPEGMDGAARILEALALLGGVALVLSLWRVATLRSLLAAAGADAQLIWPLPMLPEFLLLTQQRRVPFHRVSGVVWGTWAVRIAAALCAGATFGNALKSETTLQEVSRAGWLPLWGRGDGLTALILLLLVALRISALMAACCEKQKIWIKQALWLGGVGVLLGMLQMKTTLYGGQLLLWGLCLIGPGGGVLWWKKQKNTSPS